MYVGLTQLVFAGINEARAIFEGRKKPENCLPDVVPTQKAGSPKPGKITIPKFESKPIEKTPIVIEKRKEEEEEKKEFSYTKNLLTEGFERRDSVDIADEEQNWEGEHFSGEDAQRDAADSVAMG